MDKIERYIRNVKYPIWQRLVCKNKCHCIECDERIKMLTIFIQNFKK